MELRIRNTAFTSKLLGWLQIIGGIYGIGVVSYLTINLGEVNGAILFIVLTGYFLFGFSITAGVKLLNGVTRRLGIILSIINNSLQIIQFELLGWALTFTSGASFALGFKDGLKVDFSIVSSAFSMSINTDGSDFIFMVNFWAIIVIATLVDIWKELNEPVEKGNEPQTITEDTPSTELLK